jgi:hypothetical protein
MESAEPNAATEWSPPYIAFRNLLNLLERLENNMPPQIDRTFLTGSGGSRTQTMNALKSLQLIGPTGELQPELIRLVENRDDRPNEVRKLLIRFYPEPVRLGPLNATQQQLEEAFDAYGVSGDTRRKAIAFFLKAAAYAKVPVSPNFRTPTNRNGGSRTRKRTRATSTSDAPATNGSEGTGAREEKPRRDLRERYIEMLMEKAQAQDQLDEKLLDRIEKLLVADGDDDE